MIDHKLLTIKREEERERDFASREYKDNGSKYMYPRINPEKGGAGKQN